MSKYPLEPLAKLRDQKVDEATTALAEAVRKQEAAARALHAAESRRDAQARAAAAIREAEREALARGELRARDLARVDAWGVRVAVEQAVLNGAVERAGATEASAREGQGSAQGTLATRSAEARVVESHRERWDDERRRALEARDEEAATEAWRPAR